MTSLVRDVRVDDNGRISDHMVLKVPSVNWQEAISYMCVQTQSYRQLTNIDYILFVADILSSALFIDPAASTDRFADPRHHVEDSHARPMESQ